MPGLFTLKVRAMWAGLAGSKARERLLPLMRGQLTDVALLRLLADLAGAGADQFPLKLREAAKEVSIN
jgi:hypothetical protein